MSEGVVYWIGLLARLSIERNPARRAGRLQQCCKWFVAPIAAVRRGSGNGRIACRCSMFGCPVGGGGGVSGPTIQLHSSQQARRGRAVGVVALASLRKHMVGHVHFRLAFGGGDEHTIWCASRLMGAGKGSLFDSRRGAATWGVARRICAGKHNLSSSCVRCPTSHLIVIHHRMGALLSLHGMLACMTSCLTLPCAHNDRMLFS